MGEVTRFFEISPILILYCIAAGLLIFSLVVAPLMGIWLRHTRRVQVRRVEDIGLLDGPGADYYAMLIRDMETGREWRIYEDGQIEGWEGRKVTVFNRIPALVAAAGELGYSESESLKLQKFHAQAQRGADLDKLRILREGMESGRKQEG